MKDDFTRMMMAEGVRPLARPQTRKPAARARAEKAEKAPAATEAIRWTDGKAGMAKVELALVKLSNALRAKAPGWILAIGVDGRATPVDADEGRLFAARLFARAEALNARLLVIGGPDWTTIVHPVSGAATIVDEPSEIG